MEPEIDKILATGQESTLYEAPKYCWSFLYFYCVNLKGPNKMMKLQKNFKNVYVCNCTPNVMP